MSRRRVVLSSRIPHGADVQPAQESLAHCPDVGESRGSNPGADLPVDVGGAGLNRDGIYPAALLTNGSGHTPWVASGKPQPGEREAYGRACPQGLLEGDADHPQGYSRKGGRPLAHPSVIGATGDLTTAGGRGVSLPTA